ncbi:hypothetical protein K503DRAFT_170507 [Rhizopogon vinicolor AM-OR11-026]|uniref:Uncharacterized protein n=1 Tax=Rhizopogon vinicolor AM-OR11-026 TaxID=1314800 RepID=A0A1B7N0D1_9AGAM|nr:hypothetical protein K503DRAFT_170507 [Rhizopogon vinicolor AM-OR11-026]
MPVVGATKKLMQNNLRGIFEHARRRMRGFIRTTMQRTKRTARSMVILKLQFNVHMGAGELLASRFDGVSNKCKPTAGCRVVCPGTNALTEKRADRRSRSRFIDGIECIFGSDMRQYAATQLLRTCYYSHFRSERKFVKQRKNESHWPIAVPNISNTAEIKKNSCRRASHSGKSICHLSGTLLCSRL